MSIVYNIPVAVGYFLPVEGIVAPTVGIIITSLSSAWDPAVPGNAEILGKLAAAYGTLCSLPGTSSSVLSSTVTKDNLLAFAQRLTAALPAGAPESVRSCVQDACTVTKELIQRSRV